MFDILPNTLVLLLTILFPIFASHKALSTHDPALLTPWLTYWLTLSLLTTAESLLSFILPYLPFYAWIRLTLHLYLLLPGEQQGATFLYTTRIQPVLRQHEAQIEHFISTFHDRAKTAGLDYLKRALNYIRAQLLGQAGQPEAQPRAAATSQLTPPPPQQQQSYAQSLLARFSLPSARTTTPQPTPDIHAILNTALLAATSAATTQDAQSTALAAVQNLIPPILSNPADKLKYITSQTEKLRVLLGAFDKQAKELKSEEALGVGAGLGRSVSEGEFEHVGFEQVDARGAVVRPGGARKKSWGVWMFGEGKTGPEGKPKVVVDEAGKLAADGKK